MKKKISQYADAFMHARDLPGLSVAVVAKGEALFTGAFGVKDITTGEPLTPDSLFHMASVSKPFSATALVQLLEKGEIDLEGRLVDCLPYFEMRDPRHEKITLRQMLSHTSGMPDCEDYEWGDPYDGDDALERYARSLADLELLFDPGTDYSYSNIAFEVLGCIIARVSGVTFEEYIDTHSFSPLRMTSSTFLRREVPVELSVKPHVRRFQNEVSEVYPYNRAHAPSSTFHTNANEVVNWILVNLNRGRLGDAQILQPSSYDLLWKPQHKVDANRSVGLSWFLSSLHGYQVIGHSGGDVGFRSQLALIPEKSVGVALMTNVSPAPLENVEKSLLEILLGIEPQPALPPVFFPVSRVYLQYGMKAASRYLDELQSYRRSEYDINTEDFLTQGSHLVEEGKPDQAIDIIGLGLQLEPKSARLNGMLAIAYFESGQQERGLDLAQRVLQMDPDDKMIRQFLQKFSMNS
jgi:CubicO group peptidase (beta-lactamase class C family)